jgi:C-terminal processing protease CtpA/Prc
MKKVLGSRRTLAGLAVVAAAALLLTVVTGAGVAGSKDKDKGYIGVYMQELDKDLRDGLDIDVKNGVLINGVENGSPADEAGIEDGDVIVEFDGKKIESTDELRKLVADAGAGDEVTVKVVRDGQTKTLKLTIGEWPDELTWHTFGDLQFEGDDWSDFGHSVRAFMFRPQLGVQVTALNKDLAPYFKSEAGEGVLVLEVNEESVAEDAGIVAGDVIQTVDGEDVATVEGLRESVSEFEEGDKFEIVVLRNGKKKTLEATMDESATHLQWSRTPQVYRFDHNVHPRGFKKHFGPHVEVLRDDLSDEIEDLKKQLEEMRKELDEIKK